MSDDQSAIAEAEKLQRYRHLMPRAPAHLQDKMDMGGPDDSAEAGVPSRSPAPPPVTWPPLVPDAARDRARGCLLGVAVGDAIGAAIEFKLRDSVPPLTGMTGGGPFGLEPGQWTDDTTMTICLAESLLAEGTMDQADFMERLGRWLRDGENSVNGTCFDVGNATRTAIEHFLAGGSAAAGSDDPATAGNGSLVRLAPITIFAGSDRGGAEYLALKQSRATHAALECLDACKLFTSILLDALSGADRDTALRPRVMALSAKLLFINAGEWRAKDRSAIRSSGYVVDTLEAALWSVGHTESFADAVLTAANLGDDADSVAAVAGQLAGALYGAEAIPTDWLATLAWHDKIEQLADALFEHGSSGGELAETIGLGTRS